MSRRPPPPRESEVQRSVIVRLRHLGILLYRRNVATWTASHNGRTRVIRCGEKGQADLYGWELKTGRHWEVETKAWGKKPTEHQLTWLIGCTRQGAVAFWVDAADIAERVAAALLRGGKIAWRNDGTYDVEM